MKAPDEIVIANPHTLADCCGQLAAAPQLGFDTEFVGEETYEPSLCLIQVSTPATLFLIDPLSAGPLDAFWKLLVEPSRTVIVHAGREEIRLCRRFCDQAPSNWFDLQVAAGLVGLNYPLGYGALIYQLLGVELGKGETLTEWRHRPLSEAQIHYAFNDVRYLIPLWQQIETQLAELGRRDWARQEFIRFIAQALPEVNNLPAVAERWRRLKGLGAMDRKRLGLVREMFQSREQIAAQMNRPPRVLVRDDLLVELARRNPKSAQEVQTMRGMARRFVQPMWEAIERARKLPPDQLPRPAEREQDRPQVALVVNLLGAIVNDLCARAKLAVSLTATVSDLKDVVRARMQNDEPSPSNLLLTGWRKDFVLPTLLEFLEGKRRLRITNLQADSPFALE